jgi:N-acetylglucosamine malate deacetylase 1
MAVAYILAHFDDEYGAMPRILAGQRAGEDAHFLYVCDYARLADERCAESRRYLRSIGIDPARVDHVARGTGVMDGAVHKGLAQIYPFLKARLAKLGPIEALVCPAWEGGHADHDSAAVLATRLAADVGVARVEQFSLYNGAGLPWRCFRGATPLPEGGPTQRPPLTFGEAVRWAFDVRFFPSQAKTWVGLWPMMFLSVTLRGWRIQRLTPERVRERPHAGPLYYERVFKVPYEEVRAAADAFLSAPVPA